MFCFGEWVTSFILEKISAYYSIHNNHSLSIIFSNKNIATFKQQLGQLTPKIILRVFFLVSTTVLWYTTEVLYIVGILSHGILKGHLVICEPYFEKWWSRVSFCLFHFYHFPVLRMTLVPYWIHIEKSQHIQWISLERFSHSQCAAVPILHPQTGNPFVILICLLGLLVEFCCQLFESQRRAKLVVKFGADELLEALLSHG